MKPSNADGAGERDFAIGRGLQTPRGGGRLIVENSDSTSQVKPSAILRFDGASVTDLGDEVALVTITGSGSGGSSSDVINVTEYGAFGNGTDDDTTYIQAAIDAACALGDFRTVYFPAGTYKITATIDIDCSVRLLGAGGYPGAGSTIVMTTNNTTAINQSGDFYLTIENMLIENNGTNASGRGIYAAGNVIINHSTVRDFFDNLYIDDPTGFAVFSFIDDSWFTGAANDGIKIVGRANSINIRGVRMSNNANHGLNVDGGTFRLSVLACDIEENHIGIEVDGLGGGGQVTDSVSIKDCWFDQFRSGAVADILIGAGDPVQGVTIQDCYIDGITAQPAVYHYDINKCDRLTIIGGHVKSNSDLASLRCSASNTTNVTLINAKMDGTVTGLPATTRIIDQTDVTPSAIGTASAGTSPYVARADHVHPGSAATGPSPLLADDAASPFTFDDILQNDEGTAWLFPDA